MKKENKFALYFFPFIMFLLIFFSKLFGEANRRFIGPIESLSWMEVWNHLPKYLFISTISTIVVRFLYIEGVKQQEKELEEARKRLKGKENLVKDQKIEQDEKDITNNPS